MTAATSSDPAQGPASAWSSVTDFLRWRVEAIDSELVQLRRRRPCLAARLVLSTLAVGLWLPCVIAPPAADGSAGYCIRIRLAYPWLTLAATAGLLVLVWSVAETLGTALFTPKLRRRREATARLMETLNTGYGTMAPLDVEKLLDRADPAGSRLLTDLGLVQWIVSEKGAAVQGTGLLAV